MTTDRFAHLTGQGGERTNLEFLRGQNNELQQLVQRLNGELISRSMPTLSSFTDALKFTTAQAQAGNPMAMEQLKLLLGALDAARETVLTKGKILVPTS